MVMNSQAGKTVHVARRVLLPLMLGASMGTVSLLASAQTTTPSNQTPTNSQATKGNTPMDMRSSMMGMRKHMDAMKSSGDIDQDFAAMMRIHHQGDRKSTRLNSSN